MPGQSNVANLPRCHAKDPLWQPVVSIIAAGVMINGTIDAFLKNEGTTLRIVMIVISLIFVLMIPFSYRNIDLYQDRIVIKYPLGFTSKTDEVFLLANLDEVVFAFTHRNNRVNMIFKINGKNVKNAFIPEEVDEFILHLTRLGVKTEKRPVSL
ncbi:hypothetical protein [Chitinophaga sp. S165]|uniref:hypothetical protein n=1 Tax=Chitinophaga sp. S165 TaxID=2135462 RepID=UPI000D70CA6C|nr:hypothetical protein [Chitinophaga sp. S165]